MRNPAVSGFSFFNALVMNSCSKVSTHRGVKLALEASTDRDANVGVCALCQMLNHWPTV